MRAAILPEILRILQCLHSLELQVDMHTALQSSNNILRSFGFDNVDISLEFQVMTVELYNTCYNDS